VSVNTVITHGGDGELFDATVNNQRALYTTQVADPPAIVQKSIPFRQYLTLDGTANGANSMLVNGSVTPQEFYVQASNTADRYLTTLSFVLSDAGATLNSFLNIGALTNGCDVFYERTTGEPTIATGLVSNFDFVRFGVGAPSFGTAANSFRANNVEGNAEGFLPVIDLRIFSPWGVGLKLDAKTKQRFVVRINDNIGGGGIQRFDCLAYGFDREL